MIISIILIDIRYVVLIMYVLTVINLHGDVGQPDRSVGQEDHCPGQEDGHLRHAGRPVGEGGHRVDHGQEPWK